MIFVSIVNSGKKLVMNYRNVSGSFQSLFFNPCFSIPVILYLAYEYCTEN